MAMRILTAMLFVCLTGLSAIDAAQAQYVPVPGYFRSNGTYVTPHFRTFPDGNPYNNLRR